MNGDTQAKLTSSSSTDGEVYIANWRPDGVWKGIFTGTFAGTITLSNSALDYWSSTANSPAQARILLYSTTGGVTTVSGLTPTNKRNGISVRCVI